MTYTDTERLEFFIESTAIVDHWVNKGWQVTESLGDEYVLSEPGKYFPTAREAIDSAITEARRLSGAHHE